MIRLSLQFFGGGSSGGIGAGGSKQTSKYAFNNEPGVHGSAGGTGTGSGSSNKEEEKKYHTVPGDSKYETNYEPVTKLEKGSDYFIRLFRYATNQTTNYGVLSYDETKYLLKGYKYDEKWKMWFTPGANRGFSVYKAREKRR